MGNELLINDGSGNYTSDASFLGGSNTPRAVAFGDAGMLIWGSPSGRRTSHPACTVQ